jgi:hypothetical protein
LGKIFAKIYLSHIPTNAQNFSEFSNKVALASSCGEIGKIETFLDLLTVENENSKKENSQREKERDRESEKVNQKKKRFFRKILQKFK